MVWVGAATGDLWVGVSAAADFPDATFFLLAMVWYAIAKKIRNDKFHPRARSRFFEARTRLCDFMMVLDFGSARAARIARATFFFWMVWCITYAQKIKTMPNTFPYCESIIFSEIKLKFVDSEKP